MFDIDTVKGALEALGIPYTWHSYIAVPPSHCFATYDTPSVRWEGGDDIAPVRFTSVQAVIFYSASKTAEDFQTEERFEAAVMCCEGFRKRSGYDSTNNLFYSEYTFNEYGEVLNYD